MLERASIAFRLDRLLLLVVLCSWKPAFSQLIVGPSTVIEGNSVTLSCLTQDSSSYNVSWLKDGTPLVVSSSITTTSTNLTISSTSGPTDSGSYTCIVTFMNETQINSEPFNLTVQYLHANPTICQIKQDGVPVKKKSNSYGVASGSNVQFICCPPSGLPTPTISWSIPSANGVAYDESNLILSINNIQTSHFGDYQCIASNIVDSNRQSDIAEIRVVQCNLPNIIPTIQTVNIPQSTVCTKLQSSATIDCSITATHQECLQYELTWQKDATSLSNGTKYIIHKNNSLTINDISLSDIGTYKCTVQKTDRTSSGSDVTHLSVNCIDSVQITSPTTSIGLGNKLELSCSSEYSLIPSPSLSWQLPNSSIVPGPVLTLYNIQYTDGGVYYCFANSPMSESVNDTFSLTVEGKPYIRLVSNPLRAKLNHRLELTCETNASVSFKWKRGNTTILPGGKISISSVSKSSILTISAMTSDDIDTYTCEVNNDIHLSTHVVINVTLTTEIYLMTDIQDELHRNINSSFTIGCPVIGGVGNINVSWYKSGILLSSATPVNYMIVTMADGNPALNISSLKLSHEGTYSCVATDEMNQFFNKTFYLFVDIPGEFIYSPPGTPTYSVGSYLHLNCTATGKPLPTISWLKNTRKLTITDRIKPYPNGSLIIYNLVLSDAGDYRCYFKSTTDIVKDRSFTLNVVARDTTTGPNNQNTILGLDQTVFISIILGAIGVLFIFLIAVLICLLICYLKCCNKRNNHVPKAILETTSFERRPSVRGSLRKDNSGILQQSPSNLSSLWTFTADTSIPMTVASSSVAISPGPPIPSPVPPPNGPTASLATELNVPHSMSTFPRQNLHLSGEVMGEGEFGPVLKGIARHINPREEETLVAVKVLMPRDGEDHLWQSLMDFANQMKLSSPFVAKILGLCADEEPFYIIYEYLDMGNLKRFLTNSRPSHHQLSLTQHDLLHIISQTSQGMLYLYTQQTIHGDLATRNCLISSNLSVKIADLGIGHDLYEDDYYDNGTQLLPIRWMAPELLKDSEIGPAFSLSSDVWSFGIFCWEVFSYARQPYEELTDIQVLEYVPRGHMLNVPDEGCPSSLYSLMMDCCQGDPRCRPDFTEITPLVLSIDVD